MQSCRPTSTTCLFLAAAVLAAVREEVALDLEGNAEKLSCDCTFGAAFLRAVALVEAAARPLLVVVPRAPLLLAGRSDSASSSESDGSAN